MKKNILCLYAEKYLYGCCLYYEEILVCNVFFLLQWKYLDERDFVFMKLITSLTTFIHKAN